MEPNVSGPEIPFCIPERKLSSPSASPEHHAYKTSQTSPIPCPRSNRPLIRRQTLAGTGTASDLRSLASTSSTSTQSSSDDDDVMFRIRSASIPANPCMDRNRKHWMKKILDLKKTEAKKVKRSISEDEFQRKIKVDFCISPTFATGGGQGLKLRRRSSVLEVCDDPELLVTENNLSRYLLLSGLKDGIFCAELPLTDIPKGDLTLRVANNKLTLIVTKAARETETVSRKNRLVKPFALGYVEMPIYVEPTSLQFQLDLDNADNLLIRGMMKGMMDRTGKVTSSPDGTASTLRERNASFDLTRAEEQDLVKLRAAFRERCNTR